MYLSNPTECTAQRVNPNCRLWVTVMSPQGLISYNQYTALVGDAYSRGGCEEAGCIWEISVLSAKLCCEPKSALKKNKVYLKLYMYIIYIIPMYNIYIYIYFLMGDFKSLLEPTDSYIWVKQPTLGASIETTVSGPKVFFHVQQSEWLIYFRCTFLPSYGWADHGRVLTNEM